MRRARSRATAARSSRAPRERCGSSLPDSDRVQASVPLAEPLAQGLELASGRIKHIKNAVLLGLAGEGLADPSVTGPASVEGAEAARKYLVHLAVRRASRAPIGST